ncbi:MAG: ferritin family protein [Planctomycetes bacterium]|nr:ferritin family protein [Planctomycetota bacterium]
MGIRFNADEILKIAEQIERNGAKYYRKAAEIVSDEQEKNLLESLATMEDGHEKLFAQMRTELTKKESKPLNFDPDNEIALYLQAFADGYVFPVNKDPLEFLSVERSMAEIVTQAIGMEKDSVTFYVGIKEMVPEKLGAGKVQNIIREEMRHITMLNNVLAAL